MPHQMKLKPGALQYIMEKEDILTQRQLARKLNISAPHLCQILAGQKGVTSAFILGAYVAFGYELDHPIYHIVRDQDDYVR